jgi:hypothetical protein
MFHPQALVKDMMQNWMPYLILLIFVVTAACYGFSGDMAFIGDFGAVIGWRPERIYSGPMGRSAGQKSGGLFGFFGTLEPVPDPPWWGLNKTAYLSMGDGTCPGRGAKCPNSLASACHPGDLD